jgi:hypothetical protein
MTFTLKIAVGNDAVQFPSDVGTILRKLAEWFDSHDGWEPGAPLFDTNGNRVGEWVLDSTDSDVYL